MEDKHKQLFYSMVYTWQMQGMIQLGKLANPIDGKTDRDLDSAQLTIDMLEMLQVKTSGNLADDEKRFIDQVLTDLRLNFVDEKKRSEQETEPEKVEEKSSEEGKPE